MQQPQLPRACGFGLGLSSTAATHTFWCNTATGSDSNFSTAKKVFENHQGKILRIFFFFLFLFFPFGYTQDICPLERQLQEICSFPPILLWWSPVSPSSASSHEPRCSSICQPDTCELKCMAAVSGEFSRSAFFLSSLGHVLSSVALFLPAACHL